MSASTKLIQSSGQAGLEGAWDLSYAYYDPPESEKWDISTAKFSGSFSVSSQEANPTGVFLKPDGTKMYVSGDAGNDISEYDLSTAWNISTASFLQGFSVAAQDSGPKDVFFKPDGTKMYVLGDSSNRIYEYDLSTAWDISTASILQNFSVVAEENSQGGFFFKPDGTKMYLIGSGGDDVNEYDLSTAWDISTASFLQNASGSDNVPTGVFFKPDGTKLYLSGDAGNLIYEYDLSVAWDVSTISLLQTFSVEAQDNRPAGVFFEPTGTIMYVVGDDNNSVYQYNLGGFDIVSQDANVVAIEFKPDGTKFYMAGATNDEIYQYALSTEWDLSSASYETKFTTSDVGGGLAFKPDGTKAFWLDSSTDSIEEYALSTAWDISSATFTQDYDLSTEGTSPGAVAFKTDGTKFYIRNGTDDTVDEYDLSTAWDVSSASFSQALDVSGSSTSFSQIQFKPDGTRMFFVDAVTGGVDEYELSTAWDISTATYTQTFEVGYDRLRGLAFKPDGTKMFLADQTSDAVFTFTLGPRD